MIRRPPRSTRTDTLPTRRSSDLIDNGLARGSSHSVQIGGKWPLGVGSRPTGCDGSRLKPALKMRALDHHLQMYRLGYKPVHISLPSPENASYWAIKYT